MVNYAYKEKNGYYEVIKDGSPCFSQLNYYFSKNLKVLEYVKYFIDCKVSEEIATKYLKFLNRLFGKLVKVEYTYPKVTLTIDNFENLAFYRKLIVLLCFYRYLDETHPTLKLAFSKPGETSSQIFKNLLEANVETMLSVNSNHQLLDKNYTIIAVYGCCDINFKLADFKKKFQSNKTVDFGWFYFINVK